MRKKRNKRGQIAIWIILAVVLFASILIYFAFQNKALLTGKEEFEPTSYITKCAREVVNEAADKMMPQGGFIEPINYKMYKDIKVSYLCQANGFYTSCINLHPMLINEIKTQIADYANPVIEKCFNDMKKEAEKSGKTIELEEMNLAISLAPERIYADISRKTTIKEGETIRTIEKYDVEAVNPAYDLANTAIDIANNEAKYCYFEYLGYMVLRDVTIEKFVMSDATKIYSITDRMSGKMMNIAIRSCVMPA